jgi:hypothetical protein
MKSDLVVAVITKVIGLPVGQPDGKEVGTPAAAATPRDADRR